MTTRTSLSTLLILVFLLSFGATATILFLDEVEQYDTISELPSVGILHNYDQYSVVAHSLGAIDGYTYTDTREALENSYKNGTRLFDADINITSDGYLVLSHDWNYVQYDPTYDEFMSSKILGEYAPLSFTDLLDFMEQHEDMYIIADVKLIDDNLLDSVAMYYDRIVTEAQRHEAGASLLERIIPSFYNFEAYDNVMSIYDFKYVEMRCYRTDDIDGVIAFAQEHSNIKTIKLFNEQADEITMQKIHRAGIKPYLAIVNSLDDVKVDNIPYGIVSDVISEQQFNNLNRQR